MGRLPIRVGVYIDHLKIQLAPEVDGARQERMGVRIDHLEQRGRIGRWLFNLLHSWDWLSLLERSLLREMLIIAFSLGGFAISVTGVVLGWRRLRRTRSRHRKLPTVTCNQPIPDKEKG